MRYQLLTIISFILLFSINVFSKERPIMILKIKYGEVKIELFDDVAPNHVKRIKAVSRQW